MKIRKNNKATKERMIYLANSVISVASEIISELSCNSPVSNYYSETWIRNAHYELGEMMREAYKYSENPDDR